MKTNEESFQFEHSLDHCVEFFSKAGSIYDTPSRKTFYSNNEDILQLFQSAWIVDKTIAFKLLLWVRDCRGGAGNRSGFRKCMKWLAKRPEDHKWVKENIDLIPKYGRWDDLRTLFGTNVEIDAANKWAFSIKEKNVLAAKWAKRKDIPIYVALKHGGVVNNMGEFRRLLSGIRKDYIVETKMCDKQWEEIDYSHVPSVAMSRYTNAFNRNDEHGFVAYKESLKKGETKINADVLFPHDCYKTVFNGDSYIANAQFDALPNYMKGAKNIIPIVDSSGSMQTDVGGGTSAYAVAVSLGLYCSGKLSPENPFYKKFIQFESEGRWTDWDGYDFSEAIISRRFFDGAVGSTRIDRALGLILSTAKTYKVADENMPGMLLILSDMQFSSGACFHDWASRKGNMEEKSITKVEEALKKWDDAGYSRPQIVYWNLCPYSGQPDTVESKDIALVSGFSPSILKSILASEDFSPESVMMKALEKYDEGLVIPK